MVPSSPVCHGPARAQPDASLPSKCFSGVRRWPMPYDGTFPGPPRTASLNLPYIRSGSGPPPAAQAVRSGPFIRAKPPDVQDMHSHSLSKFDPRLSADMGIRSFSQGTGPFAPPYSRFWRWCEDRGRGRASPPFPLSPGAHPGLSKI